MNSFQSFDNGICLKNFGIQLQNMGTQIQNMGMQISNINQFFGNQMQNMGCQINNLGMNIFNIGMTIQNSQTQNNMQMFMMQQIQNNMQNQMINDLNNNINMNQILRNQNQYIEKKNMKTFNFLNTDGNMEINNNIDLNGNEQYINILISTTTGLKLNIICNSNSTLEEFLKQFQKKFLIGDNELDNIFFIFNATKLNLKDKNKKLRDLNNYMVNLTVIDMNHMVCRPIGGVIKLNVHGQEYILKIKCSMNIYEFLGRYLEKVGKNKENKKLEFLKEVTVEDFFEKIYDSKIEDKSEKKYDFNCHK